MSESTYRAQWRAWQTGPADKAELLRLARKTANTFMDHYLCDGSYETGHIELLCEMATSSTDAVLNQIAASVLFESIVEPLCDDFEEPQQQIYIRVMAQVVDYCRRLNAGQELDTQLHRFGIFCWEDLYCRARALQDRNLKWDKTRRVDRIYILSRVTIGADVTIVSVLANRLTRIFPQAQIILLGNDKLEQLFGANKKMTIRSLEYEQHGGLAERFKSWQMVAQLLQREEKEYGNTSIIIDPDSRISQLGLLPLAVMSNYFFFNSRGDSLSGQQISMSEMVNEWVDYTFGRGEFCRPAIWLAKDLTSEARRLRAAVEPKGITHLTTVNFGVGGNTRKRLGIHFEARLLRGLLAEPGTMLILDKGFGPREHLGCQELLRELTDDGFASQETSFGHWNHLANNIRVLAVDAGIGQMAALIATSDDFIGYDSACQHIAAALGVRGVTVFAGTNNPRFIRRWSECSGSAARIVHANTLSDGRGLDYEEIVERVLYERDQNIRHPK